MERDVVLSVYNPTSALRLQLIVVTTEIFSYIDYLPQFLLSHLRILYFIEVRYLYLVMDKQAASRSRTSKGYGTSLPELRLTHRPYKRHDGPIEQQRIDYITGSLEKDLVKVKGMIPELYWNAQIEEGSWDNAVLPTLASVVQHLRSILFL